MSVIFYGQEIYAGVHPCLHAWAGSWLHRWNWVGVRLGNHWDGRSHRWHTQVLHLAVMWWWQWQCWCRETTQTILSNEDCMTREGEVNGNEYSMAGRSLVLLRVNLGIIVKVHDQHYRRHVLWGGGRPRQLSGWQWGTFYCGGGKFYCVKCFLQVDGNHHLAGVVSWGFGCAVVNWLLALKRAIYIVLCKNIYGHTN